MSPSPSRARLRASCLPLTPAMTDAAEQTSLCFAGNYYMAWGHSVTCSPFAGLLARWTGRICLAEPKKNKEEKTQAFGCFSR